jgi:hypothetical protein
VINPLAVVAVEELLAQGATGRLLLVMAPITICLVVLGDLAEAGLAEVLEVRGTLRQVVEMVRYFFTGKN